MSLAVIPGSFDPMTKGHLDIIKRAAGMFDSVVVAVMINEEKKYMFTLEQRKKIAEFTVAGLEGVSVISSEGYLADLSGELGAAAVVKGVRTAEDFVYEQKMAEFNHERNPSCETVYLPSYGKNSDISSTLVRLLLETGRDASEYVAPEAMKYINRILSKRRKGRSEIKE